LTLRTAYNADNIPELLRQIETREPVSPRRLNPSIPFDLETIVLKAISKHRSQRYATAQELADDFRRFVAGDPIAARRPSYVERSARWCSRHKNLVATAAAVIVLALLGTSAAVVIIARAKSATDSALAASKHNLERSQSNFRQSREVLDHFGVLVADRLAGLPGTERLRNQVLQDTLQYYERFIAQAGDDPTLEADLAMTCFKSGEILDQLGSRDKALASYERARGIFERLEGDDALVQVATCHNNIALLLAGQGNVAGAKRAYGEAIRLYERRLLNAATDADCRLQLASACGNLALLLANTNERSQSLRYHQRALDLHQELVQEHPQRNDFRRELAMTFNNLSFFHRESDPIVATKFNEQAIELLQEIVSMEPENLEAHSDLALSFTNQGSLLAGRGEYPQAERAYRGAVAIYGSLLAQAPHVFAYRRDLSVAHNNLGRTLTELRQYPAAQAALEDARDVLQSLARDAQSDLVVLSGLGGVLNNLGMAYEQTGDYKAAIEVYEQAIALQRSALARSPQMTPVADFLNRTLENHARALMAAGRTNDTGEAGNLPGNVSKP
jgi:tetratricopeptide (TPR) repeat protein